MWATVRRYEGVTDPEEAGRRVAEGFVPLISGMRGFVAYYWFDAGERRDGFTSIFEDRSHEEESNEKAASWVHAFPRCFPIHLRSPRSRRGSGLSPARAAAIRR